MTDEMLALARENQRKAGLDNVEWLRGEIEAIPLPAATVDESGVPVTRVFKDDIMRNYDVREMKDDSGNVELYYSFPTPNILVIGESPYTFNEVLSRLQSARKL